jgi:hypothetical protein
MSQWPWYALALWALDVALDLGRRLPAHDVWQITLRRGVLAAVLTLFLCVLVFREFSVPKQGVTRPLGCVNGNELQ